MAVVGRLVKKKERDSTKGESIYKIKNTHNRKQRIHNKKQRTLKNISRAIRK
jgi:hypothetical protein